MVAVTGFLDVDEFKLRMLCPEQRATEVENKSPGWLQTELNSASERIRVQLRKRYAVETFAKPYPDIILRWLRDLVTPNIYAKLGTNPSDEMFQFYKELATQAQDEIDEAADAENGKFELPLRADTTATGVSRGGPFSTSQASPYAWMDAQRERAVTEDSNG